MLAAGWCVYIRVCVCVEEIKPGKGGIEHFHLHHTYCQANYAREGDLC